MNRRWLIVLLLCGVLVASLTGLVFALPAEHATVDYASEYTMLWTDANNVVHVSLDGSSFAAAGKRYVALSVVGSVEGDIQTDLFPVAVGIDQWCRTIVLDHFAPIQAYYRVDCKLLTFDEEGNMRVLFRDQSYHMCPDE